jgi:sensor histidine kinase regulating citrate/malate metabolism
VTILWKNIFDMHGKPIRAVGVVQPVGRRSKGSNAAVISNLQLRLELQDSYLKHVSEYLKELRHYRHDSSNNVIALKAYLAHGDTKSALEYLNRLGNNLKSEVPIIDTGNPAIDAIITEKLSVAKRKGISITQTVGIQPGLRIDMMDLTIAVASCMDNAIEACSKVISSGDSAYIELKFVEQRGALVFKLRNSSPLQVVSDKGLPETTKGDKANHGFGLRNVQRIVKKYGGQLYLKPGLSEFTTSFALILS